MDSNERTRFYVIGEDAKIEQAIPGFHSRTNNDERVLSNGCTLVELKLTKQEIEDAKKVKGVLLLDQPQAVEYLAALNATPAEGEEVNG